MENWIKIKLIDILTQKILLNAYVAVAKIIQNVIILKMIEMEFLNLLIHILEVKAQWKNKLINNKIQIIKRILFNLAFKINRKKIYF